jgi:hypothetical protein
MKTITLIFKSGAQIDVAYTYKVFNELQENLGKDHKMDAKNFSLNTKNLDGIFYSVTEDEE